MNNNVERVDTINNAGEERGLTHLNAIAKAMVIFFSRILVERGRIWE